MKTRLCSVRPVSFCLYLFLLSSPALYLNFFQTMANPTLERIKYPEVVLDQRINEATGYSEYLVRWALRCWGTGVEWVPHWVLTNRRSQLAISEFEQVTTFGFLFDSLVYLLPVPDPKSHGSCGLHRSDERGIRRRGPSVCQD